MSDPSHAMIARAATASPYVSCFIALSSCCCREGEAGRLLVSGCDPEATGGDRLGNQAGSRLRSVDPGLKGAGWVICPPKPGQIGRQNLEHASARSFVDHFHADLLGKAPWPRTIVK